MSTTDSLSDHERLNKAPYAEDFCEVCYREVDGEGGSPSFEIRRCSQCKNCFYCSKACQNKHWKTKHKFECSLLPDPFRTQLVRIIRLFYIHFIASPASKHHEGMPTYNDPLHHAKGIEWTINGSSGSPTKMWAAKFVCRPGELSPTEYSPLLMYMWNVGANKESDDEGEENPESDLSEEDKAYENRYTNLMVVYRALFMTAMF